jgi:hypothetical protein
VDWLVRPVLDHGFDFVAPYYDRHPFEGALTKGMVYPLVRALYGVRLRQPAAAEFACSGALVDQFLAEGFWERDGAQVGIDLWLTTAAASGDFRSVRRYSVSVRIVRARATRWTWEPRSPRSSARCLPIWRAAPRAGSARAARSRCSALEPCPHGIAGDATPRPRTA